LITIGPVDKGQGVGSARLGEFGGVDNTNQITNVDTKHPICRRDYTQQALFSLA